MDYCGLDLGKKSSHFCIVDSRRDIIREGKVRNRPKQIRRVFGGLKPMRIVLEATTKSFWLAERLRELGHEPIVVDPGRTKAIGAARIKHDKLDARVLAELCQTGLVVEVSQPTQQERIARMPFTLRDSLVRARVKLTNTIRSLADSEGVEIPSCSPGRFRKAIEVVIDEFPEGMLYVIEPLLVAIEDLNEQISSCETMVKEAASENEQMALLQTCPGVGPIVASGFVHAVRDPKRFRSARNVGAYFGLVPSLYASGNTYRRGRITKCGNRQARWLLTMAANSLMRSKRDSSLKRWALSLCGRTGRSKAVVALARKLAGVLWAMLRDNRKFEDRLLQHA
jgi:transposase